MLYNPLCLWVNKKNSGIKFILPIYLEMVGREEKTIATYYQERASEEEGDFDKHYCFIYAVNHSLGNESLGIESVCPSISIWPSLNSQPHDWK